MAFNVYFVVNRYWHCRKHFWATVWQNQQNDLCTQRRLGSAWTYIQSDQRLRCLHIKALCSWLPIDCTTKDWSDWAGAQANDLSLRWVHMPFCWFCHAVAHLPYHNYCTWNDPKFSDGQVLADSLDPVQTAPVCQFVCIFWTHYSMVKPHFLDNFSNYFWFLW